DKALACAASVVLINKKVACPPGKALLISEDPFSDFNKLTNYFNPFKKATDLVSSTATIGENTIIQPNVFIGNNVRIGTNCVIHSNVVIYDNTVIGNNVTIHAGTILGADGFYYKNRPKSFDKLLSGGNVVIQDDVDLGALCTIDKGVTASTTIGQGSKLDNQVHVGHDTVIGKRCLIAAQVCIAGCVVIEDLVTLWGQVGITSGVTIGKKAVISGQSGVSKSLEGYKAYFGSPADEIRKKHKELASIKLIPSIIEKIDNL
ncbi:MAG: UDP-3-O-(3-hydroxymyristoyl)glucosamine N-acyltransferase, partial [Ulvibacter sp.]|nr:UDP-3-O-(3-hydroxymyristoyl)glucosamine N-acyltransferase [Ulvibacter sp.]